MLKKEKGKKYMAEISLKWCVLSASHRKYVILDFPIDNINFETNLEEHPKCKAWKFEQYNKWWYDWFLTKNKINIH